MLNQRLIRALIKREIVDFFIFSRFFSFFAFCFDLKEAQGVGTEYNSRGERQGKKNET